MEQVQRLLVNLTDRTGDEIAYLEKIVNSQRQRIDDLKKLQRSFEKLKGKIRKPGSKK